MNYDAVEQFWNLLVRAADPRKEKEEFGRVSALVATLYYQPDDTKASAALRPSPTLNGILAQV